MFCSHHSANFIAAVICYSCSYWIIKRTTRIFGYSNNNVYIRQGFFYVLLTVHLSISLDNDQLDAHLLYFTIRPLHFPTCFEHYMLIIMRVIALIQHLVSSSQSVAVRWTGWEITLSSLSTCALNGHWLRGRYQMLYECNSPPDDEHLMLETCRGM